MIDKLKTFVSKHKQEFDSTEPSQDLWKKIDAKMEVENSSTISSKWLSKLKYFGLSASVLMIAVYFISQKLSNSSSNELAQNKKDSALNSSGEWAKANQSKPTVNESGNIVPGTSSEEISPESKNSSLQTEELTNLIQNNIVDEPKDSVSQKAVSEMGIDLSLSDKAVANSVSNKKENTSTIKKKKGKIIVPPEPEKVNSYTGTIYDGFSFCSVLRAYKFPGKVSMNDGGNFTDRLIMKTMSCSRLDNMPNIKAIWFKGKTSKKMTISIKEGFKNILLVKGDGRELSPEAISHYYPGLGVISGYAGKHFEMIFRDKVELILFFKDAEEGDKVSIDGTIEAIIKSAP